MKSSKSTMIFLLIIFLILAIEDYNKDSLSGLVLIMFFIKSFFIGFLAMSIALYKADNTSSFSDH